MAEQPAIRGSFSLYTDYCDFADVFDDARQRWTDFFRVHTLSSRGAYGGPPHFFDAYDETGRLKEEAGLTTDCIRLVLEEAP